MGALGSIEQLVELLGKAEDLFGGSHSLEEYFRGVCDLLVPALADWCEISLVENGQLIRQASQHVDPQAKALADRMLDSHPRNLGADGGAPRAIRERASLLHSPLSPEVLEGLAREGAPAAGLRQFALNSIGYVPLTVRDRAIGVVSLANTHERALLSESDLMLVKAIATRTAAAVEKKSAEARLSAIADHTNALIYIADLDGKFIFANRAYEEAVQVKDLAGRSMYEIFPPETTRKFADEDRQVVEANRAMQFEEDVPIGDTLRSYVTMLFPLRDGDGRTVVGGISTDVTERKRIDRALRQAQKMDLVGRLAGGIAHEYNNLLTTIAGNCELALNVAAENQELRNHLDRILRSAERAAKLTHRLLVFAHRQVRKASALSLGALVADLDLTEMLGPRISVSLSLDADLPPVSCDPNEMKDVIASLVMNARDAMPNGGELRISTSSSGGMVRLEVADSGCGMSEAVRARIFEPFFTTKSPGEGVGLGLSTVLAVIEECGGHIDVESRPGEGTRVLIDLPAAEARIFPQEPQRAVERPSGTPTVLLVEDEPDLRETLSAVLTAAGYRVLAASGAVQALALLRSANPRVDLLLCDVVMPGMSGRDLAEKVRREWPAIRVLLMSGDPGETLDAVNGLEEFFPKPFEMTALIERIDALIGARALYCRR